MKVPCLARRRDWRTHDGIKFDLALMEIGFGLDKIW